MKRISRSKHHLLSSLQLMTSGVTESHCPLDATKQHEKNSSPTDHRPNSRVQRPPLSAPLGPGLRGKALASTVLPFPGGSAAKPSAGPLTLSLSHTLPPTPQPPAPRPRGLASPAGLCPPTPADSACGCQGLCPSSRLSLTRRWTGLCLQHHLPWGATPASTHPPAAPA